MAEAVNVILAELFAARIDVLERNFIQAVVAGFAEIHSGFESGEDSILRAKNDVVDFALARGEFAVGGNGASDVGGIAGELRAHVEHDDVTITDFARELVVMQRSGVGSG